MKYYYLIIVFFCLSICYGQQNKKKTGPIIENYGAVFSIEQPDLILDTKIEHKAIFDVYTDITEGKGINPLINTVARFLNMHGQQGVPKDNMNVILVLHGKAAKSSLNTKENMNLELLKALDHAGVTIYVCGQSLLSRKLDRTKVSKHVKVSLSSMTALTKYQSEGYAMINFN